MAITFLDEPKSKVKFIDEPVVEKKESSASLDDRINARGGFISPVTNPIQSFKEFQRKMSTGGGLQKTGAFLEAMGMPITQTVSAVSAPITEMTRQAMPNSGGFDPRRIVNESVAGFTGAKQYKAGDTLRAAGYPEGAAIASDVAWDLAMPLNVIKAGYGALPAIVRRGSDKGIALAGQKIVSGVEEAKRIIGSRLDAAYKYVNDFKITSPAVSRIIGIADDVPSAFIKEAESQIGKPLTDLSSVAELRQLKGLLGKAKSTAFGRKDLGVAETIEAEKINKAYKTIASIINDTVESGAGKKFALELKAADNAFTETTRAGDLLKSTVMSKKLMKPTKAGKVAAGMIKEGDMDVRVSIDTIKKAGGDAKKNIGIAIKSLDWFNKKQAMAKMAEHAAGAAIFGGMMGAVGGKALQKVSGGND